MPLARYSFLKSRPENRPAYSGNRSSDGCCLQGVSSMSGKWRVLIVLCSLVSVQFCLGQEMQTECADSKCIQVGSYNLELFGSGRKPYGGVNRGPRSNDEIDRIAACISTELDLEIVVFQEINTASDEWTTLKQKLASHGYKFHEGTTSDRHQFVVLAWDEDDVSLVDNSVSELDVRTLSLIHI